MIDKKSKILDKYDKQMESTINEVMKRVITIFDAFVEETLIYENHFAKLTKKKLPTTTKREYTVKELKAIFDYYNKEYSQEEYNFIKFLLFTGLRRNEALSITKEDIYFENDMIDIDGTKTENAKRVIVIHNDIKEVIILQLKDKDDEDYLFFNTGLKDIMTNLRHKEKSDAEKFDFHGGKIGTLINKGIKDVVGETAKKDLDIHSIRKNHIQELFLLSNIEWLDLQTLIGHSTNSNTTDKHYLRGKRNFERLKKHINETDFLQYFSDIN